MATLSLETDPGIDKLQIEGLRQMPPWRKLALVGALEALGVPYALGGSLT
jgi:hypothetical protein